SALRQLHRAALELFGHRRELAVHFRLPRVVEVAAGGGRGGLAHHPLVAEGFEERTHVAAVGSLRVGLRPGAVTLAGRAGRTANEQGRGNGGGEQEGGGLAMGGQCGLQWGRAFAPPVHHSGRGCPGTHPWACSRSSRSLTLPRLAALCSGSTRLSPGPVPERIRRAAAV